MFPLLHLLLKVGMKFDSHDFIQAVLRFEGLLARGANAYIY